MKSNIDLAEFIQAFVYENQGPAESYRRAGYVPEGAKDNAALLAQRYLKKDEVLTAIEEAQRDRRAYARNLTLNAIVEVLEKELPAMATKEKVTFLMAAADKLGVSAPKQIEHRDMTAITATQALAKLNALLSVNPRIIDATPNARTGEGNDAADSGNRGE